MSSGDARSVVTVEIAGEEYKLRSDAPPEYTRECAAYLDQTLAEIHRQVTLIEAQKAAILAALSLTDQLFQARAQADALRREVARLAGRLAEEVEAALDLAPPP
ncbi:MAG: cell division protein ZapA [Gemmatimonadetes bacterium]|nr:cell division protein ZapA [Gemmatimonadota bacterium]